LGFDWEANDYFHLLADMAERDQELQIVYGIDGEADLQESVLDDVGWIPTGTSRQQRVQAAPA
jgi:GH15 family glucan-1,4-alpha-glucosidase